MITDVERKENGERAAPVRVAVQTSPPYQGHYPPHYLIPGRRAQTGSNMVLSRAYTLATWSTGTGTVQAQTRASAWRKGNCTHASDTQSDRPASICW